MNPLLKMKPDDFREICYDDRFVLFQIGNQQEKIEFPTREEMAHCIAEWIDQGCWQKPPPLTAAQRRWLKGRGSEADEKHK